MGKSTLLTSLTGIYSEAASYEFTTLTCIPGVILHRGAKIQLLDLPGAPARAAARARPPGRHTRPAPRSLSAGIIEGAKDGKGRGRQVISTARTCHCIIIVLDAMKPLDHKRIIERELEGVGIRLNKKPPAITVTKKEKGGLNFSTSVKGGLTHLDEDGIKCAPRPSPAPGPQRPASPASPPPSSPSVWPPGAAQGHPEGVLDRLGQRAHEL